MDTCEDQLRQLCRVFAEEASRAGKPTGIHADGLGGWRLLLREPPDPGRYGVDLLIYADGSLMLHRLGNPRNPRMATTARLSWHRLLSDSALADVRAAMDAALASADEELAGRLLRAV